MRKLTFVLFAAVLNGCEGDPPTTNREVGATGDTQAATANEDQAPSSSATSPQYYVDALPNPCLQITEAVARNVLKVREVIGQLSNSRQGSANPRCSYRDGEGLGKNVSVVAIRTPYEAFNAAMPVDELLAFADLHYGQPGAAYRPADFGPGVQRFVAETDDSVTMFVMTGLGVAGGAYDAETMVAGAAFAVTLQDRARSADEPPPRR